MRQPDRVWSTLRIKALDEEKRILEGIASTPSTDRMGDIVEPMGAKYELPLPVLWQHNSEEPIGSVIRAAPNANGIPCTIQIVKTGEPGRLKDRLDEAWQSVKLGLVKGLSIGFQPLEHSYIESTGGYRYSSWSWLELSCVTVPANAECSVAVVKRCDLAGRSHPSLLKQHERSDFVFPKTWREMTPGGFAGILARKMVERVGDVLVEALKPLNDRVRILEMAKRELQLGCNSEIVALVEAAMAEHKYCDVWKPAPYKRHNSVTYRGHLWIAKVDTSEEPGTGGAWRLAVKKGRDGNDIR